MRPMVSVIIPNLHSPMVDKTIDSVKNQVQVNGDFEIIVVGLDEHSLVRPDGQVKRISTEKPVIPATARNIGIGFARGDVIVYIDADCVADRFWLSRLLSAHEQGADLVGGSVGFTTDNYWTLCDNLTSFHEYLPGTRTKRRLYFPTINLSIKREVMDRIGPFDESLPTGEDIDLTVRCHLAGYALQFEPAALVYHHPDRANFGALVNHAAIAGGNSLKVRQRYPEVFWTPKIVTNRHLLIGLSPLLALYGVLRVVTSSPAVLGYWYTLPAIYVAKLAWCWGASRSLQHERRTATVPRPIDPPTRGRSGPTIGNARQA